GAPPGADARVVADVDGPEDARVRPDDDVPPHLRVAHLALERGAAEDDALVEKAPVADAGRLADHDAHAVVDDDAPSEVRRGVDLDAREEAVGVGEEARAELDVPLPHRVGG